MDPALARLLAEQGDAPAGALFETAILDEVLRWASWQPEPPGLHFFRTHAGREVDLVLHAADRLLAIEVKASQASTPTARTPAR
jgi:predicted AAA+ superfamily ATPase